MLETSEPPCTMTDKFYFLWFNKQIDNSEVLSSAAITLFRNRPMDKSHLKSNEIPQN